ERTQPAVRTAPFPHRVERHHPQPDLLPDLADHRVGKGLTGLDRAAWKTPTPPRKNPLGPAEDHEPSGLFDHCDNALDRSRTHAAQNPLRMSPLRCIMVEPHRE